MLDLSGRTLLISGGSRGIGLTIARTAGGLGANVALLAKTDAPDPRLPGTIHTAAEDIAATGARVLPIVGDVRDAGSVARAVDAAVHAFGGIDFCINNASAISLAGSEALAVSRFDLMQQVNVRGTWLLTQASLPHLRRSPRPHILTLSPPLNMNPRWLGAHPGYTVSKYGMTILTLGWAAEFAEQGIAANCLWPETLIATAAVKNVVGSESTMAGARDPQVMADAAVQILARRADETTGHCLLDSEVLADAGISDLTRYGGGPDPVRDLFLD
jgi:citronellol/citronellal dehydrogenase